MGQKLSSEALTSALARLHGWTQSAGAITKSFEFPAYKDGVVFACAVAYKADAMDHHPDLTIGYRRVSVLLSTHSAGGVTELDVRLAEWIETL